MRRHLVSVGKGARGSMERSLAKSLGSRLTKNSITVLELTIGQEKPVGREETSECRAFPAACR
jgi:hypothetical protein